MVEFVIALVAAVFGSTGFWAWLSNRNRRESSVTRLILGLAYAEIIRRSETYIERGYIATDEYNELSHYLYEPYRDMGGDGTAEKLIEEVKKLPTRKEG